MLNEYLKELGIDRLLTSSVGQKLQEAVKAISGIQQGLYNLADTNDSKFDLLKIGTVFQVFSSTSLLPEESRGIYQKMIGRNLHRKFINMQFWKIDNPTASLFLLYMPITLIFR